VEEQAMANSEDPIKPYIEQLYEDEALTDALTDQEAKVLLGWAEQQLRSLSPLQAKPDKLDSAARQLRRMIRTINQFMGQQAGLSETQMVQRLLRLVEQTIQFSQQKSLIEISSSSTSGEQQEA
jgi:hypothetical protein